MKKAAQPPATCRDKSSPAISKPAAVLTTDTDMIALLGRLAQRASQADQLVAHLKTQLGTLRQSAGKIQKKSMGNLKEKEFYRNRVL